MRQQTVHFPHSAERIQAVRQFIHEHMDQQLDRAALARIAGFSIAHLHRMFAAVTGQSIARYVRRARLERAGRKLRMGAVDISEVALAAGYDTHTAFAKAFKKAWGLSPSEFRRLGCHAATQILKKTGAE